ncbi:unnamed protein product [Acanthocheilonema viteae]|uniref:Small ribosomal subunit protein mS25 n=1 Tax=Acanthocheilonema viteae TaxID=6277 RepID=A0A498SFP5_ACAVI|nr:unnamed protein product [Acanthocheilonema viteae]
MQQMYSVKPYLNSYENIRLPDVMYSVRSYHDISYTSESIGNITSIKESLEEIINRQLELVNELISFIDHLSKTLLSSSSSSTKIEATFREPKILSKQQFTFRKGKVGTSPKEEIGTSYPSALTVFETVKYCMNTITLVGDIEELWLKNLAKVGVRASILFEGLNDGISAPRCTIKLQAPNNRESLAAEINGTKVTEHILVWKLLGALILLYPTTPVHADICTHIDYWLLLIDDVLSNRSNEDNLCRHMSTALSYHDYLVPNVSATLADVLAYSVITKQLYYANNVELWLRRMDRLLHFVRAVLHHRVFAWAVTKAHYFFLMSFKLGTVPLRRTYLYLQQGTIQFRDCVKIFAIGYKRFPRDDRRHKGVIDFVFWHWAQLQYSNPYVQLVRFTNISVVPFGKAFLDDGREVLFDLEDKTREEIEEMFRTTLGKTKVSLRQERLEKMLRTDQALFGKKCKRECICEVQGQHPCTSLLYAPDYMKGKWRWNHNI